MAKNENALKKRREKLKADILKDPDTSYQLIDHIDSELSEGVLKEAVESDSSLILMDWSEKESGKQQIIEADYEEILCNSNIPVFLADFTTPVNALERVILVVAATTVGVKFDDRAAERAKSIAEAMELPLIVLATAHYYQRMKHWVSSDETEDGDKLISLPSKPAEEIVEQIKEQDLVILPSMGSHQRFNSGDEHIPYQVLQHISSSVIITHFP